MPLQATSGAASYDGFGGGVAAVPNYIEDVFSTYLYTGTAANQTIANNVNLSTYGGLVWLKSRSVSGNNWTQDSVRGVNSVLYPNLTNAAGNPAGTAVSAFNTNGFSLGSNTNINNTGDTYVSWTFRKQPKFFDVVTYTGNGVAGTQISHNLGSTPGCIMVKRYAGAGGAVDWAVWHNQLGGSEYLKLNTTDAGITNAAYPPFGAVTSTYFTVGNASATGNNGITNSNGDSFVAYVFAHNAGGFGLTGTDNVISCGFFMTDASANASVTLGYEPQWVLIKRIDGVGYWDMLDNMRGMTVGTSNAFLWANTSDAEMVGQRAQPFATGFNYNGSNSASYIYIAIRRGPMKVPTSGTSVFEPALYTGDGSTSRVFSTSTVPVVDSVIDMDRSNGNGNIWTIDRLRGGTSVLQTYSTAAQSTGLSGATFDKQYGYQVNSASATYYSWNTTSQLNVQYFLRRAPSFFDEVCYTGTGANRTVTHNLGVAPELMIVKRRDSLGAWNVWNTYIAGLDAANVMQLESTDAVVPVASVFNSTSPTSSVFTVGTAGRNNASGGTYVAYLFATCAGVSKVGNYTGNGSSQTINCGFTGGARFVLIKRTDSAGDWYVWDTARGIISANDPHLSLNTTAAEVTTDDTIDPDSTGFIVNQVTATNVNVSSATYIYLAIA